MLVLALVDQYKVFDQSPVFGIVPTPVLPVRVVVFPGLCKCFMNRKFKTIACLPSLMYDFGESSIDGGHMAEHS